MEIEMIYHSDCGMPVELCECEDAEVIYDWSDDIFRVTGEGGEYE